MILLLIPIQKFLGNIFSMDQLFFLLLLLYSPPRPTPLANNNITKGDIL